MSQRLALSPVLVALAVAGAWLVLSLAASAEAAFPGRNGRIAYVDDLQHGIYTVWPNAFGTRLLVRGTPGFVFDPAYSPSGQYVAFIRELSVPNPDQLLGSFESNIEVVGADGRGRRRLTRGEIDSLPDWSPDGRSIVFRRLNPCQSSPTGCPPSVRRSRNYGILVYQRGRTRGLASNGTDPSWSPNGRQIAFVHLEVGGGAGALDLMNADGSGRRRIFHPRGVSVSSPDWSPDGRRIVFTYASRNAPGGAVATIRPDGRGFRRLIPTRQPNVSYSPDGRQIVFERGDSPCDFAEFWVMRADGSRPRPLDICGSKLDWGNRSARRVPSLASG